MICASLQPLVNLGKVVDAPGGVQIAPKHHVDGADGAVFWMRRLIVRAPIEKLVNRRWGRAYGALGNRWHSRQEQKSRE